MKNLEKREHICPYFSPAMLFIIKIIYARILAFVRSLVVDQYNGTSVDGHNTEDVIVHDIY